MFIDINKKTTDEVYERAFKASSMIYGVKKPKNVIDVYKQTGVFNFNDHEKVEIADNTMSLAKPISHYLPQGFKKGVVNIRHLINHKELFDNVDYLDNVNIHLHAGDCPDSPTTLGYNDYINGEIHIFKMKENNKDEEAFLKTIAHETQHAIQRHCGWDLGGSPEIFNPSDEFLDYYRKIIRELSHKYGFDKVDEYYSNYHKRYPEVVNPLHMFVNATPIEFKVLNMAMSIVMSSVKELHVENYHCLFGEIEAEATAQKINQSLEQRMRNHPYSPNIQLIKHGIHRRRDYKTGLLFTVERKLAANLHKQFITEQTNVSKRLEGVYEI